MLVELHGDNNQSIHTQLFYSKDSLSFTEKKSVKPNKIIHNVYYYILPSLSDIQNLRFDPSTSKQHITINKIQIIEHTWLSENRYNIQLNKITHLHDITDLSYRDNSLSFKTVGIDSQLQFYLPSKPDSIQYNFHLNVFLLSFLILLVIVYLYKLYKNETFDEKFLAKMILYSIFLFFAAFKVSYYSSHINKFYPPDELAHLSYIDHVYKHTGFIPDFHTMRTLNNKEAGLYLSHPPLYYQLMLVAYDTSKPIMDDANIQNFRGLNSIIFMLTFILILYFGFSTRISILGHFVYLSIITSIPMYAYSGASITNDNLAILGAVIFILGLKRMLEEQYSNLTYIIIGFGIFISYFSKLTVAILIFLAFVFFLVYLFKNKKIFSIKKIQIMIIITFLLPIAYYQIYILAEYHSIMPTFNVTYPDQYLKSVFYTPEKFRLHYTPIEWLVRMKEYVIGGWFGIHSHHSFVKSSILEYLGLLILHIFALLSLFIPCDEKLKKYCILGKIMLLSLLSVLLIQYLFSYKTHLHSGYMGGLQPRYLLPFMFAFAIMSSLFVERFKHYFLFSIIIILICIHAIYSDFFYFLQYYH